MARLDENLGAVGFDNLIHSTNPPAEVFSVELAAGQGVLERGTLLAKTDGGFVKISAGTTGKANAVLADTVDTGDGATVTATAYRTGHFNTNGLKVADGYDITDADKEALRTVGILLSDAVAL